MGNPLGVKYLYIYIHIYIYICIHTLYPYMDTLGLERVSVHLNLGYHIQGVLRLVTITFFVG